MPQFAANLSMMYPEMEFLDRFGAAAADGFAAVEYLFPYAYPANELSARLKAHGLQQVLFNAPAGGGDTSSVAQSWARGDRGTACVPGREREFQLGVERALDYAQALACPRIHLMAGLVGPEVRRSDVLPTYLSNLAWAAALARRQGVDVLIEPINTRDVPGFFLNRQDQAHDVLAQVGADNLKVQMDLYHCQIVEGDVAMKLRQYLPTGQVGHIQIAGVPHRHEPDVGELNYGYLFDLIDELSEHRGWQGWLGCEYRPRLAGEPGGTTAGLGWFRNWR
jgi:hydroxypyruvate isomerase